MSGDCRIVNQFMACSMRKISNDGVCWPMTELFLPLRDSFLLSPRTASYMDALIREGDKFDYSKWLERVREGEAQAKQGLRTFISKDLIAPEIGNQTGTSDGIWPKAKLMTRVIPRALRQTHYAPKDKAPQIGIRQRLEIACDAWDVFQASRTRDAACSQSLNITEYGEGPRDFCGMPANSQIFRLTTVQIYSQPSFAARLEMPPITRRSANGRARCGM
jgi:hypothetical protein